MTLIISRLLTKLFVYSNLSSPPLGPTSEATELAPELELAPDLDPASENPVQLEPTDDPLFRAKQL